MRRMGSWTGAARGAGWLAAAGAGLVLGACSCNTKIVTEAEKAHLAGDFARAAEKIDTVKSCTKSDTIYLHYQRGKILQDAGRFAESQAEFDEALRRLGNTQYLSVVSVSGAGDNIDAILTDDTRRDYFGTHYDRVMLRVAMAINELMDPAGNTEDALALSRQQLDLQNPRVRDQLLAAGEQVEDVSLASSRDRNERITAGGLFERPDVSSVIRGYEGYTYTGHATDVVPYGFYVGSLVSRAEGSELAPEWNSRLRAVSNSRLASEASAPIGNKVYVLFENGMAPHRTERRFGLDDLSVKVPDMRVRADGRASGMTVQGGGRTAIAEKLTDVDSIVMADFSDRITEIWGRPFLSAAIRVGIAVAVNVAVEDDEDEWWDDAVKLGTLIGVAIWQAQTRADLRSWRTLPGEQFAAELPMPEDGVVRFNLIGPTGQPVLWREITVPTDRPIIVFARSTDAGNLSVYWNELRGRATPRGAR